MKKSLLTIFSFAIGGVILAQTPEDGLRYSWQTATGTARVQSLGGASGALGGEISTMFSNPANIGFYKTGDLVVSGGLNFNKTTSTYFGSSAPAQKSNTGFFGTSGIVLGKERYGNGSVKSTAFALGINRVADFNGTVRFNGRNTMSSMSEKFLDEVKGIDPNTVAAGNGYQFGPALALNTYWIDYDKNTKQYLSNAAKIAAKGGVDQDELLNTSGGITEFAIAGAANFNDKVFIGGTIGLPTLRYSSNRSFLEMDPDENDATNGFNYAEFKENLTTTGAGINAKLGIVVKPTDMLRLGFTVHTPTFYTLKDNYWAYVKTDRENYAPSPSLDKVLYMASDDKAFPGAGVFGYTMRTPYKLMGSLALMFGDVTNVASQRGFLTADVEYVNHKATRFSTGNGNSSDNNYFRDLNSTIQDYYKGAVNARVGVELKFNTLMVRGGGAYYGSPYANDNLKSNIYQATGGIGYRNRGVFVDLGYVQSFGTQVYFPYHLNKGSYAADIKNNSSRLVLTLGFKI